MVSKLPVLGVLLPHKPKPPLRFFFTIPIVFLLKLSSLQSSVFGKFHSVILVQSVSEFFVLLLSTTHSFNKIYIFHHALILTALLLSEPEQKTKPGSGKSPPPVQRCAVTCHYFILQWFPARAPHVAVPCRTFPESSSEPPCLI
jgi:hypothetical protein